MLFSYIITYRASTEERINNLKTVLSSLKKINSHFEIILVEQDCFSKAVFENNIKHIFIKNNFEFNRSWGFNVGAKNSDTNILVFADSDIMMRSDNFLNAIEHCETYWNAINPKGFRVLEQQKNVVSERKCNFCGGICIIKKDVFFKINGWDEDFEGWGGEDDVMEIKITKMLDKTKTINFDVYHLYHQSIAAKAELSENYKNNLTIIEKIKDMNKDELFQYYSNKKIGNINKYA